MPRAGVPGGDAVPALRAGIPGPPQGDRPEHGVDDLLPVAGEHGLVAVPAVHPGTTVAGVGGQRLPEDGPGRASAARRGAPPRPSAGRSRSPASWRPRLPGGLPRRTSPPRARPGAPFFPFRPGGVLAAGAARRRPGLADRLVHLDDLPHRRRELACRAISRRTFSTSPAANCRPTVLRRPTDRVHRTAARDRDAPGPRMRSSAFRTCASSRSPTPAGSHRPAELRNSRSRPASSSGSDGSDMGTPHLVLTVKTRLPS